MVLDTAALAEMLGKEMDTRYWARLTVDPVRYADQAVENLFPELVAAAADTLRQFLSGVKTPEMAVPEFLAGTTLLKGVRFKPEREVRIVAIPGTAALAKHAAREFPKEFDASAPLPAVQTRTDTGKRYIPLFAGMGLRLPIKRVMVGPGSDQADRAVFARSICDAPVVLSRC